MRNMTFGTFSTDGPKATGLTSMSLLCLVCAHEARPSQPARLIDFLSALLALLRIPYVRTCARRAWPSGGGGIRGLIVDRSSRLTFRLSRHIPKLLQINATCASARALDEGGKVRGDRELACFWAELSNGPLERKILNIYWIIYIFLISPPPPRVSALPQKYAGPVSSRPNQMLPCNIEETQSEGTVQCDLKTVS